MRLNEVKVKLQFTKEEFKHIYLPAGNYTLFMLQFTKEEFKLSSSLLGL